MRQTLYNLVTRLRAVNSGDEGPRSFGSYHTNRRNASSEEPFVMEQCSLKIDTNTTSVIVIHHMETNMQEQRHEQPVYMYDYRHAQADT